MFLTKTQLDAIGFKSIGEHVLISDKASIYRPDQIEIGDNVRIDDFCILSAGDGGIKLGSHIHLACYVALIGAGRIELEDYAQIAQKSYLMSSTDDFSGEYLTGTQVPEELRNVKSEPILFKKYAVLGAMSIVFPGVTVGENTAIGCMSMVKKSLESDGIYAGNPLRFIKNRQKPEWENAFLEQMDWWK